MSELYLHNLAIDYLKVNPFNGRFSKNHVPVNKGKKMSPEVYEKVKHTFFKKGVQSGNPGKIAGWNKSNLYDWYRCLF